MPMTVNKDRSPSYAGTFCVEDAADMLELEELKKMVSNWNKQLKSYGARDKYGKPIQYRVCLRGRDPYKKMKAPAHWLGIYPASKGDVKYDWAGNILGGLKNARKLDAYIYRRYEPLPD